MAILVRPQVYIGNEISLGPGKIDLLRRVGQTKSGRELGIPYKRAWLLINTLNVGFGQPVVLTTKGGRGGGGAQLTPLGQALIERYQALEARIVETSAAELEALKALAG